MTARSFNGTTEHARTAYSSLPSNFAIACWVCPTSDTLTMWPISVSNSTVNTQYAGIQLAGAVAGDFINVSTRNVTTNTTSSGVAFQVNTWQFVAAAFAGSTQSIMVGTTVRADAVRQTPTGINNICIGGIDLVGVTLRLQGQCANACMWDLSDWGSDSSSRVAAFSRARVEMAKGRPMSFYRIGLVDQWRLRGNLSPENGRFPLTLTGTSKATQGPPVGRRYNGRSAA